MRGSVTIRMSERSHLARVPEHEAVVVAHGPEDVAVVHVPCHVLHHARVALW